MSTLDTRLETFQAPQKVMRVEGCKVRRPYAALSASALAVLLEPGIVVVNSKVRQVASQSLTLNGGSTLAASKDLYSAIVAEYIPEVDGINISVVNGTVAATGAATAPTDAEIEAALIDDAHPYTLLAMVKSSTDGSSVVTHEIDHRVRSFGVPTTGKNAARAADYDQESDAAVYKPWGKDSLIIDAADIANGDLLTNKPLPLIYGRIARYRIICEKAITTAAKTTDLNLEIGTTNCTGTTTYAGTKALGTVTEGTALSANNTFAPGANWSIEAANTTAFVEGRLRIEIDIEELIT